MAGQYYKAENYEARKSIGYLIRRSRNLITQGLETIFSENFSAGKITFAQWVVLMCLRDNLAKTPAELCQTMCYDSGALTRLLDQMEDNHLIKRRRSTKDRRVVRLSLTPEGRKTVTVMIKVVAQYYNGLLDNFTAKEVTTFVLLLTRLIDNMSEGQTKRA